MYIRVFHYGKSSCLNRNMQNFIVVHDKQNVTCKHCLKEIGIRGFRTSKARLTVQGATR